MKNFILSIIFFSLIAALTWVGQEYITLRKDHTTLSGEYQKALAKYQDEPLIVRDTIRDTSANKVIYVYEPIRTAGDVTDYVSKGLADTLLQSLKAAKKKILSLQSYTASLQDSLQAHRHTDEQGYEWIYTKDDPVFDIRANLSTDTIYAAASFTIDRINARTRKSIFHRWQYQTAIRASDTRINITGIRDVQTVPKPSKFGIGITVGPTFTTQGISYGATAGLSYDIISF